MGYSNWREGRCETIIFFKHSDFLLNKWKIRITTLLKAKIIEWYTLYYEPRFMYTRFGLKKKTVNKKAEIEIQFS